MKSSVFGLVLLVGLLGGLLGGAEIAVGQPSADPEGQAMADTIQYALEYNRTNQSSDWVNPDTGNSGGVVPVKTYEDGGKGPCREFITTIVIGGEEQQGYGTACRQPDGTWELVAQTEVERPVPKAVAQAPIYITHPPPRYYYYPAEFYYPYRIYLSFGYVYRSGHAYRGSYYLDGHSFRHRHPIHIHQRSYITHHDLHRHNWFDHRHRSHWVDRPEGRRSHNRLERRGWDVDVRHDRGRGQRR